MIRDLFLLAKGEFKKMPMFDFACSECGNIKEKFVKDEKVLIGMCEVCEGQRTFNKVIGSPNLLYYPLNTSSKLPSEFKNRMDAISKTFNKNMINKYC